MKLPIDVFALLSDALDIERARAIDASVCILIDESASPELQAFVRAGFVGESPNARVTVGYLPNQETDLTVEGDVVVVVAGSDERVGPLVRDVRAAGIPALAVAVSEADVRLAAEQAGAPLAQDAVAACEPDVSFEDAKEALADRVGAWIVETCPDKRLAFAVAFPFVRRPLAREAIRATALQNAGVGVVVFIPGADMPIMTANQAKMVLQIAAAYGQPLGPERVKELAGVLVNAFFFRGIARQAAAVVPALGWAVKGALGYAGTQAIGRAAIEYFEHGGDVAGLSAVVGKAAQSAVQAAQTVRNEPVCRTVADGAVRAATTVLDAAAPVAQSAGKVVFSTLRPHLVKTGGKRL